MSWSDLLLMVVNLVRNIVYLIIAIGVILGSMQVIIQFIDVSSGINFKEHLFPRFQDDPKAVSLYASSRIAAAILGGCIVAAAFIK